MKAQKRSHRWFDISGFVFMMIFGGLDVLTFCGIGGKDVLPYLQQFKPYTLAGVFLCAIFLLFRYFFELRKTRAVFRAMHKISHSLRDASHLCLMRKIKQGAEYNVFNEQDFEYRDICSICNLVSDLFRDLLKVETLVGVVYMTDHDKTPTPELDAKCFIAGSSDNFRDANGGAVCDLTVDANTRFKDVHKAKACAPTLATFYDDIEKAGTNFKDEILPHVPYRSTIVVPLRCAVNKWPSYFLGFLFIQNKNPGSMDPSVHAEILAAIGDQISPFLQSARAIRKSTQQSLL